MTCPYCYAQLDSDPSTLTCAACHQDLPDGWTGGTATTIALAGPSSSGKTVYIGVLIKELQRMADDLSIASAFKPVGLETDQMYKEHYEKRLFDERKVPGGTASADTRDAYQKRPMIWSFGLVNGQQRFLVIHDIAGEDLEGDEPVDAHVAHFKSANVVLYFIDPLSFSAVANRLPEATALKHADPNLTLKALVNIMNIVGNSPIQVGLVISKFDHLHSLSNIQDQTWQSIMDNLGATMRHVPPPEASFRQEEGEVLRPDPTDRNLLHTELWSLMRFMGQGRLADTVRNPHTWNQRPEGFVFCLFAVSALGEASMGESLNPRGISPYRVLDPIIWALEETWTPAAKPTQQREHKRKQEERKPSWLSRLLKGSR